MSPDTTPLGDLPSAAEAAADEFEALNIPPRIPLEEEIIARSTGNHEPLPMLDVIFARLSNAFSPMLKQQGGFLTETSDPALVYSAWGEAIAKLDPNGVAAIAKTSWGGSIAIAFDAAFLHAAISYQLGGRPSSADVARRPPTTLERAFAQRLMTLTLDELAQHVGRITEVVFTLETVEGPNQLGSFLAAGATAAVCTLEVEVGPLLGMVSILLPMQTLEPVRGQLSKMFLGEKLGADTGWREHFSTKISSSTMPLTIELHKLSVPLAEILQWRPGVEIDLGITTDHEAKVICSERPILFGATGRRRNGRMALRITREIDSAKEGQADDDLLVD